jgi:hypothetical protein
LQNQISYWFSFIWKPQNVAMVTATQQTTFATEKKKKKCWTILNEARV